MRISSILTWHLYAIFVDFSDLKFPANRFLSLWLPYHSMVVDHFCQSVKCYCCTLDRYWFDSVAILVRHHNAKHKYLFDQYFRSILAMIPAASCKAAYEKPIFHHTKCSVQIHTLCCSCEYYENTKEKLEEFSIRIFPFGEAVLTDIGQC